VFDKRAWRRFTRNKPAVVGAFIVGFVILVALFGPLFAPHDPNQMHFGPNALSALGKPQGPSAEFPLGTDAAGRCVLSRLLYGARVSLEVGFFATALAIGIGLWVGLIAGYFRRVADGVLMRLTDMVLAFPFLLLVITVASMRESSSMTAVFIVLGVVGWTTMARVIRGKVLSIREMEYVQAARAVGAGHMRIIARHILPNVVGPTIVLASIGVANFILSEAVLSYLGLGVPPPDASWGSMLYEGQTMYTLAPRLIIVPGLAILITVLGFNLFGEGLRDAFDPKDKRG
jgi:ABC-type dipeptide/oligopeptide/nickel transport system permease subunit